jgi:DNA-binding GntR family transcriptional regulator
MDVSNAPRGDRVGHLHQMIRRAIEDGHLVPGQRLIEIDLTREYGVSRGPLREALRLLAVEGIVEIVPNRGAVVRRMTPKEIIDTMTVRMALEGLAASEAARNIDSGKNRARMEKFITRHKPGTLKPMAAFLEENKELHAMLVEFADNRQLSVLVDQMRLQLFPKRTAVINANDASYRLASSKEHLAIAKAVLRGDETKAAGAMQRHLDDARERLMAQLGEPSLAAVS